MPILVIPTCTRSLQSTGKQGIRYGTHTDRHTTHGHHNFENELAKWVNSVKILLMGDHSSLGIIQSISENQKKNKKNVKKLNI